MEQDLAALLENKRALTILKLQDGWMITFADIDQDDEGIVFIPNKVMLSTSSLAQALSEFHAEDIMLHVEGLHA